MAKFPWKTASAGIGNERPLVLRAYHRYATDWDFQGSSSPGRRYWEHVDIGACRTLVNEGLKCFTEKDDLGEAWDRIFRQNGGTGYVKGQKVAIKLNWNDCTPGLGDGPEGNSLVSNTELVQAVTESMLTYVPGLKPENILIGDPSRNPYGRIRAAISLTGATLIEFKEGIFAPEPAALVKYPNHNNDYVCRSMFGEVAHLIEMPLLKAISPFWGISGALKDAQGKVGFTNSSFGDNRKAWIAKHGTFSLTDRMNTLVPMNSHPWIKGKRRIVIADGIFGLYNGQHFPTGQKDDIPKPWTLFENKSPNSILLSTDPVAIDCVMHDLVRFERVRQGLTGAFFKPVKFLKPIQLACASAGLGINDDPVESDVFPSPAGPMFSYRAINYKIVDITSGKPTGIWN